MKPFGQVRLVPVNGNGPEDVVVDATGAVYTGFDDGRIIRVSDDGRRIELIADTGGRPLGLELYGDDLLVCDASRGLLVVSPTSGAVKTLATSALGKPIMICNNAAVAADGTIYFSDSSDRFPLSAWREDLIEQHAGGRLLRCSPDGQISLVGDGLQFANGVALAPDESFVAVAETGAFAVRRYWLDGSGRQDLLASDLAGYPDNISTGSDGLIWVTQASPRVPALDLVRRLPGPLRLGVRRLPVGLQPSPSRTTGALGLSVDGAVVHDFRGEIPGFHMATGIRERDGLLYLGSLEERAIAITSLT
ncbi:SMP-30/gluconolactonase/LRE family protein [Saccharothrix sp. AJ9571]|nr:SMP-30/gluconolactonase/LRE family protein [Saccharothrix sp. AJ9571]